MLKFAKDAQPRDFPLPRGLAHECVCIVPQLLGHLPLTHAAQPRDFGDRIGALAK
jgi:hypothetical protein